MIQLTKTEIINETVAYYSEDVNRRAIKALGSCFYHLVFDGVIKQCAVGRCLIDSNKVQKNVDSADDSSADAVWNTSAALDEDLKPEYRGHSLDFWTDLQKLHDDADSDGYWDSNEGLTEIGRKRVAELLAKWENK